MNRDKAIEVLKEIEADMKRDAEAFDGQPFTGKTVGTYFGYHGAAIAALARVVRSMLAEEKEKGGGE